MEKERERERETGVEYFIRPGRTRTDGRGASSNGVAALPAAAAATKDPWGTEGQAGFADVDQIVYVKG